MFNNLATVIIGSVKIHHIMKPALAPVSNRHFAGKKLSFLMHILSLLPILLITIYAAVSINSVYWFIFAGIILFSIVDYVVFDSLFDKIGWKLLWSRLYKGRGHDHTKTDPVLKAFEVNPSQENYEKLSLHLR